MPISACSSVTRHEPRLVAEQLLPLVDRLVQPGDVPLVVREQQPATTRVVAVDRPLVDESLHQRERVEHRVDELAGERAVPSCEVARPVLELRDDHAAVAGARTGADRVGLDDHGAPARAASSAAAVMPQYPPPTITVSASAGNGPGSSTPAGGATPTCHSGVSENPGANGAGTCAWYGLDAT